MNGVYVSGRMDAARLADALSALQDEVADEEGAVPLPRPWLTTSIGAATVCVPLALGGVGALSWAVAAPVGAALLVFAAGRIGLAWHDLRRMRGLADRLLRSEVTSSRSPLALWRAGELTSKRVRRRLRRETRALRAEVERTLAREAGEAAALAESIVLLERVGERLADAGGALPATGILELRAVLTRHKWTPRHFPERSADLPFAIDDALRALTVR